MSRRGIAVAVAVVVTVAVATLVLTVGIVRPPPVPSLQEADVVLPTAVAALRADGDRECVIVVAPDGELRTGTCAQRWTGGLAVDGDGRLLLRQPGRDGTVLVVLDPETGERVGRELETRAEDPAPEPAGDRDDERVIVIEEEDGDHVVTVVTARGERDLVRLPAVRGHDLWAGPWSPEGEWLLLLDSDDRILAVGADGAGPALVATDARAPVWVP